MDDLEEMMMMEAIRLSLASEEERRKREEKEVRKEAKKRGKEAKKAEKAARKAGLYSNNASSSALDAAADPRLGKATSSSSSFAGEEATEATSTPPGKGKAVERVSPPPGNADLAEPASSSDIPTGLEEQQQPQSSSSLGSPVPREPTKPSHLRHISSASSSFSSLVESTPDEPGASTLPVEGASSSAEPLFNFRSLAAVIGDEEKADESAEHVEHPTSTTTLEGSASHTPGALGPTSESLAPDPSAAVEKGSSLEESQECIVPKEVEARPVEFIDSRNAETTTS